MAKLKVFRTAIGFHDAYVATTSRKAALEAWGSDKDLFAMGAAELVTDPKLTEAPLASPGKVVRRTRGGLREHLAAAGPAEKPAAKAKQAKEAKQARPPRAPRPRPSRDQLAEAEKALAAEREEAEAQAADFDRREAALRKERREAEARRQKAREKLEKRVETEKARYDRALDRWRAA